MFGDIPQGSRALLWMAVVLMAGVTGVIYCAIIPLVRALREQNQFIQKIAGIEHLVKRLTELEKKINADKNEETLQK